MLVLLYCSVVALVSLQGVAECKEDEASATPSMPFQSCTKSISSISLPFAAMKMKDSPRFLPRRDIRTRLMLVTDE